MSTSLFARSAVAAALVLLTSAAHADAIVSATPTFAPTTELITFDGYDGLSSNSLYLDDDGDVLLTSTSTFLVGADALDLGANGNWGVRVFGPTATGEGNFLAAYAPINFNFEPDGPQAQVGAYFNLFQDTDPSSTFITLTAFGQAGNTLETWTFNIDTTSDSYNEGSFLGIARPSADIYSLGVSGGTFALDNLSLTTAPIPEPGALMLMLAGLGLIGATRARRSRG